MPAPDTLAERLNETPISRALFSELEGVDTRSVNKFKWDQIIQSHIKLERELAAARAALQTAHDRLHDITPVYLNWHLCIGEICRDIRSAIEAARGKG